MERRNIEDLSRIGYVLQGAGSDDATIALNKPDCILLGLLDEAGRIAEKGQVEVNRQDFIFDEKEGKPLNKRFAKKIPIIQPDGRGYAVHVGSARQALELQLDGRAIEGRRQPEADEIPRTEMQPA